MKTSIKYCNRKHKIGRGTAPFFGTREHLYYSYNLSCKMSSLSDSPSPAPYLPRRSSRLGPKRWAAHFAKHPTYNEDHLIHTFGWLTKAMNAKFEERHQTFPGVNNTFTHKCVYLGTMYNILIDNPHYLLDHPTYFEGCYKKATYILNNYAVQQSKNWWVKHLKATLHDFFQMCEYIHLCM